MSVMRKGGYDNVLGAWFAAAKLSLFAVFTLFVARILFLVWFSSRLAPDTGYLEIFAALMRGLRYDLVVGFYAPLPLLAFGLANLFSDARSVCRKFTLILGGIYCFLTSFAIVASLQYVKEYGDHFNHFLFGLLYDDREAILKMVWSQYGLLSGLVATALMGWLLFRRFKKVLNVTIGGPIERWPRQWKISATMGLFVFFMTLARGGLELYPVQFRDRDVTQDAFLNKMVLNPWMALKYAVQQHSHALNKGGFKNAPQLEDVKTACARVSPGGPKDTVEECLSRAVAGEAPTRARHVFLIIIESYDSWPFLDKYAPLKLVEEGKKLAGEGMLIRAFLPADNGTMTSLSPIISGMYNPGMRVNYQPSSQKPYAAAPAVTFARNGYATRFISGGSLSWQRLGEFAANQGFSEVYGAESIKNAANVNEWGVDDGSLFKFALSKIDDSKPSFNVILTTGNHPTYSMDLKSVGWSDRGVPTGLAGVVDGTLPETIMGHLWYSDQTAAAFAREAAKKFPGSLVAITGDHFSRKFINQRPTGFESTSVPLILYGPEVLGELAAKRKAAGAEIRPDAIAGSHMDVLPTLYELSLAPGTPYQAVGRNLFDPARIQAGMGRNAVITPDFIMDDNDGARPEALPWSGKPDAAPKLDEAKRLHRDMQLLSWWRIMKGGALK